VVFLREDFEASSLDALGEDIDMVAIDFAASWCGPCKRQTPLFKRVAREVAEDRDAAPIAFLTVDVENNRPLADRYRVKSVPTTLILAREPGLLWGERWIERKRFQGVIPLARLQAAVEDVADDLDD
jgi:thiol-disulfide isomerase/thioredoxin